VKVRVLYFASLRERAGAPAGEEDLPPGATAGDLWDRLRGRAAFASASFRPGFSINGEWARAERVLGEGDEVGLLPPVSGG
jgi:molybdopterin converting factor small subunit